MFNFFKRHKSAESAKERLQLVLIHDRINLSPAELEALKDDLIETISRHVVIDPQAVRIAMEHEGRSQRLVADIPIQGVGRRKRGKAK